MRYPKFLPENGTIGFVAPSFGCAREPYRSAFENAQRKFRELGYGLWLGPNCYTEEGVGISNTPEQCGRELTEGYCGAESDVLISCGGGELMCETLPYVDFDRIREAAPKWYMGYSDNTNFTYLLTTLCDTASVYGPCAAAFGMEPWHESLRMALDVLTGKRNTVHGFDLWEREQLRDEEHPLTPYHVTEPHVIRSYVGHEEVTDGRELRFSGRLLGGCMDCLVNLLGTRFDRTTEFIERYRDDGILWFLESCDLNVFGIRRAMWQMEQAGWFTHAAGFLIGRPLCFGQQMMNLDAYGAVLEAAGRLNVPIVMDLDIGHLPPQMPVVTGALAEACVTGNTIEIRYDYKYVNFQKFYN